MLLGRLFLVALTAAFLCHPVYAADYCHTCERDETGRIKRSPVARYDFRQANPCPATGSTKGRCQGYVIDHVIPLKRGGPDHPSNMQWQTVDEAKDKDKWE